MAGGFSGAASGHTTATSAVVLFLVTLLSGVPCAAQSGLIGVHIASRIEGDFSVISGIAEAPDGVIAIAQPEDARVLLFGPDGTRRGVFGRKGGGPGEFELLHELGVRPDGFWAEDPMLSRITLFTSSGQLLATFPEPAPRTAMSPEPGDRLFAPRVYALGPADTLLLSWRSRGRTASAAGADLLGIGAVSFTATTRGGTGFSLLGRISAADNCVFTKGNAAARVPFCAVPLAAADPYGTLLVLYTPGHPDRGTGRITAVDVGGSRLLDKQLADRPAPVPNSLRDSLRHEHPGMSIPMTYPLIDELIVGVDSTIWLRRGDGTDRETWMALNVHGEAIGRLVLPPRCSLKWANATSGLAVEYDEDDIASVIQLRFSTP